MAQDYTDISDATIKIGGSPVPTDFLHDLAEPGK